jgi:CHAT domain-containing protein
MTTVSPEASAESLPRIPDLEISIRLDGTSLLFEVHAPDPSEALNRVRLHSKPLPKTPEKLLHHLFKDIEGLSSNTEEDRREAKNTLTIKALEIWEIFPRELQDILWRRRRRSLTLWIQSDEPYIPWEIAKLQSRDRGRIIPGPFLCEAFAVTRWLHGMPPKTRLPMARMALVVPHDSTLPNAAQERTAIRTLAERHGRHVQEIEAKAQPVREALATGTFDAWHFAGHGVIAGDHPDRASIRLDDYTKLSAEDLRGETANLGLAEPLVFFNGCTTGQSGFALTGLGGWPHRFLQANAGAFIGTYWSITDGKAGELAETVYKNLFKGLPIGEAFRLARRDLHKKYPGDPTWLAYTVFAHPLASCKDLEPPRPPAERKPEQITIPVRTWRKEVDPPGALLRAQYGVVPFHRREKEISDLQDWCHDSSTVKVRLYTGPGGMGKTRLALEAALKMRAEGWWAGFATNEAIQSPEKTWKALNRSEGKLLLIVDYAETNRPFLIPILREMHRLERGPVRLLLLARAALDWWEQLKSERDGVGDLVSGPATSRYSLQPLADTVEARADSYGVAAQAFSEHLTQPLPAGRPDDLDAKHFERALLLHMSALIDVEGKEKAKGEDGILDRILSREKNFWQTRAGDQGIEPKIVPGVGRALAAITLGGGVQGESEAIEVLRGLQFFTDQPAAVLTSVARLLHECYPGERWIEPIQPDLLGEHLVQRELEQGADELLDLVLGPRSGGV